MNVGEYVRTENGDIGVIINCPEKLKKNYGNWLWFETSYEQRPIRNEDIIKSSPQIIDLIEVGDLMYIDISPDDCGGIIVPRISETANELNRYKEKINNGEYILKSIVTHEQMEAMQYRVEE